MALCFTESSLRYEIKHSINTVIGICGIDKRYFQEMLEDENIELNSLFAGERVYNYFLDKANVNKIKAIELYKGIITQKHLVTKVIDLENKLKQSKD